MKIKVKVDDVFYDVEVGDLQERPIVATVDGEVFEIWPETKAAYTAVPTSRSSRSNQNYQTQAPNMGVEPSKQLNAEKQTAARVVRAPIPGVITAISIQAGDEVVVGQELCKLEAMKMNNSVRAAMAGKIASIRISVGQQVKHGDILMDFAEEQQ